MQYQFLDWDSKLFGVTVARINEPDLDEKMLTDTLFELKGERANLVYWPARQEVDSNIIEHFGGSLVDIKTTFVNDLRSLGPEESDSADGVEPFGKSMLIKDVEDLAVQSGEFSRFSVDRNIPKDKFLLLYKIWINRSIKKEIAKEVLVIREGGRVVGMVTLGSKNERGEIGLIAVDKNSRGKKCGKRLVRASAAMVFKEWI